MYTRTEEEQEQIDRILEIEFSKMSERDIYLTFTTLMYAVNRARQEKLMAFDGSHTSIAEAIAALVAEKTYSKKTFGTAIPISMYHDEDVHTHYEMMYEIIQKYVKSQPKGVMAGYLESPFDSALSLIKAKVTIRSLISDFLFWVPASCFGKHDYLLFMLLDHVHERHHLLSVMDEQLKASDYTIEGRRRFIAHYEQRLPALPQVSSPNMFFKTTSKSLGDVRELKQAVESGGLPDIIKLVRKTK